MYGFTIIYNKSEHFSVKNGLEISFKNHSFFYEQGSNFLNDKVFTETTDYIIGIDGVILNLSELLNSYAQKDLASFILSLHIQNSNLVDLLNGDFSGFIFDKKTEELVCFTNQIGSQKLFYTQHNTSTIISHRFETVCNFKKDNSLNISAAYDLLTYGGMMENKTLVEGVYRLIGGERLSIKNNILSITNYCDFNTTEPKIENSNKAIELLNSQFEKLIKLEYEKDVEYNYKHYATLSGGLDSRMNVMTANKLGYKTHNFCFSQSGYADHLIAEKISKDLNNPFTFISLDNAEYLTELEENLSIYDGLIFYLASAHFNFTLNHLNMKDGGLIHTGQIGDAILGGFVSLGKPNFFSSMMSDKLAHKLDHVDTSKYASEETFKLYNRLFNVTIAGSYVASHHNTYLTSPFIDPTFIKLCLSLGTDLKKEGKIYINWINKLKPEIAKYKWEKTGFKPNAQWKNTLSKYTKKVKKSYYSATQQQHKSSMNPYDYWLNNNQEIASFFTNSFNIALNQIENKELKEDVVFLFNNGNTIEKSMVLTLLYSIKKLNLKA